MKTLRKSALYLATAAAALTVSAAPAWADDPIVVTAQRQEQSVLDVPLSIQAMSGEQLADSGIRQVSDLAQTTPGFLPNNANGYNQMFIRGVGNSIFVGADPSVATFIDDVPRVWGTTVNNFVDVERVEVIKGAPGGLYGRNATGGAVNIITRQPDTDSISAKFRVSYGEKDTRQGSAFVNLPLGEVAAMTMTAEIRKHDPYVKNVAVGTTPYTPAMFPFGAYFLTPNGTAPIVQTPSAIPGLNQPVPLLPAGASVYAYSPQQAADAFNSVLTRKNGVNNEDFWALGAKLLIKPTDNFKITFAADYSRKKDDNGNGLYNTTPLALQPATDLGLLSTFMYIYAGAFFTPPADFLNNNIGKYQVAQRNPSFVNLKDYGGSATAVLSLDSVDITSITAYRENKSRFLTDFGFNGVRTYDSNVVIDKTTFYQELRAVSANDGPFQYIVGASFLRGTFDGGSNVNILPPALMGVPANQGRYVVKNWSAYAQLGYDLTDELNLTVSGRYISETNDSNFTVPVPGAFHLKEDKFLPSATLKYSLASGGNVYVRWARGFKSGGVNPVTSPGAFPDPYTQGGIFKGETIDTFEAGVRTPLANRSVQLTAAIFYNDYKNIQTQAHVRPEYAAAIQLAILNAGTARTYGGEIGVTARVADPLTLNAAVGYLNAKYKNFVIVNNPVIEDADYSGQTMISSPKWHGSCTSRERCGHGLRIGSARRHGWRVRFNQRFARRGCRCHRWWQRQGLRGGRCAPGDGGDTDMVCTRSSYCRYRAKRRGSFVCRTVPGSQGYSDSAG